MTGFQLAVSSEMVYTDLPISTSLERDEFYRSSEEYRATCATVSKALQDAILSSESRR